jgi:thymidine phosphorylase
MIDNVLNDNSAYLEFTKWINSISEVNVDKIIDDYNPKNSIEIKSSKSGTIDYNDIEKIALVNLELGAGRKNKDSKIDFDAGIYLNKKSGNKVEKNDIIATLYSDKIISENLIEIFNNSYEIK